MDRTWCCDIKFSNQTAADKVQNGHGFGRENFWVRLVYCFLSPPQVLVNLNKFPLQSLSLSQIPCNVSSTILFPIFFLSELAVVSTYVIYMQKIYSKDTNDSELEIYSLSFRQFGSGQVVFMNRRGGSPHSIWCFSTPKWKDSQGDFQRTLNNFCTLSWLYRSFIFICVIAHNRCNQPYSFRLRFAWRPENGNAPFRLLEVANLDFNSLMGKVGGWKALPREGFDR